MNKEECRAFVKKYLEDTMLLLDKKNERYGDSVLNPRIVFPTSGCRLTDLFVRVNDKLSRIDNQVPGEDEDVVRDLTGYLLFASALFADPVVRDFAVAKSSMNDTIKYICSTVLDSELTNISGNDLDFIDKKIKSLYKQLEPLKNTQANICIQPDLITRFITDFIIREYLLIRNKTNK